MAEAAIGVKVSWLESIEIRWFVKTFLDGGDSLASCATVGAKRIQ